MNDLLAKQQADDFAAAMTSDRSKKSAHQINFEEVPIHTASREGSSRSPPTANKMDDHDGGTSPIIVKRLQQSGKRASHTNKSMLDVSRQHVSTATPTAVVAAALVQ